MSNVTLSQSVTNVIATISAALESVVEQCQNHANTKAVDPTAKLTVESMAESLAQSSGLPKQLLQLVASEAINGSTEYHMVRGKYGGVVPGMRPEPVEKKPSEKKILASQVEELKAQIAALQSQKSNTDTESVDVDTLASELAAE